jgi:hypothetical protein
MAGERLAGKNETAIPARGNLIARCGGCSCDRFRRLWRAGRLFATGAVLREGFSGENHRPGRRSILGRRLVVGALDAVERGARRKATRDAASATVAIPLTTTTIVTSATVVPSRAIVAVVAVEALLRGFVYSGRKSWSSGFSLRFCRAIDLKGGLVGVGIGCIGLGLSCSVCLLAGVVALATATAAAPATTPTAASVCSGSAFAEGLGLVGTELVAGLICGVAFLGRVRGLGLGRSGILGRLVIAIASTVAAITPATSSAAAISTVGTLA